MEHAKRPEASGPDAGGAPSADETLRRLGDRLERASEAAERLLAQAAGEAVARVAGAAHGDHEPEHAGDHEPEHAGDHEPRHAGEERPDAGREREPETTGAGRDQGAGSESARRPPPAGWQIPGADPGSGGERGDLELLATIIHSLRDLIPPELQHRLAAALRELLLAIRALIDWYLERVDRHRAEPVVVEDIPIL
jgi:hypothetical protein